MKKSAGGKVRRNRYLALIGATSIALVVCGCSNGSAGGTSNTGSGSNTGSAAQSGGSAAWQAIVKKANAEGKLLYYTDSMKVIQGTGMLCEIYLA
jgi:hypothetical protein